MSAWVSDGQFAPKALRRCNRSVPDLGWFESDWGLKGNMLKALMIVFGLEVLAFAIVGCGKETTAPPQDIREVGDYTLPDVAHIMVIHDDKRHVTCWVARANGMGVSCLPDDKVTP